MSMNAEDRFDSLFQYYASISGLNWKLLKAQAKAESGLDPDAKSHVGAKGLAQFMDRTWEEWRDGTPGVQPPPSSLVLLDPRDPEDVIRAQAAYMAWLLKQMKGDIPRALAAYNWGIGHIKKVPERSDWRRLLPAETRNYVARIETYLKTM